MGIQENLEVLIFSVSLKYVCLALNNIGYLFLVFILVYRTILSFYKTLSLLNAQGILQFTSNCFHESPDAFCWGGCTDQPDGEPLFKVFFLLYK